MTIYGGLIFGLWLILVAYWSVSTRAAMRRLGRRWLWWREIAIRLGFFAWVVIALQLAVAGRALPNAGSYTADSSLTAGITGFVCSAFGIGLAILARGYLGRGSGSANAGGEGAELVTTGPYAFVRHPLYSGLLFAILGSAIGQSLLWLLPLIVYAPLFIRSARHEERLLSEQFPERYRDYMKRTKMLLPFVL
jgi:protein-S-isoprenylcysteine O-methyltransferase Ste14